jgi:hypothetical protein
MVTRMPSRLPLAAPLLLVLAAVLSSCGQPGGHAGASPRPARTTHHQATVRSSATPRPAGPTVTLRPDSGPIGTHVQVAGSGFDPDLASASVVALTLNREFTDGCGLVGGVRIVYLHVTKEGRLNGQFVLTAQGDCFQEPGRHHAVAPGLYQVAIGCMACDVHAFRVTKKLSISTSLQGAQ